MKRVLFLLLILLGLLTACTDSPTEPGVPGGGGGTTGYTVVLTPASASAYITGDAVLSANEIIEITATVRKDGAMVSDRTQVIFEIFGTGAAFVESGTAYYNTYTVNGAALATLFATTTGTYTVKATARISDNSSVNTTKNYTFFEDPHLSVTDVNPKTGSSVGGDTVTITGTGFMQPLQDYVGTQRAQFVSGTSTEMTVLAPVHYASDCNANDVVDVKVVIFPGQTTEDSDTASNIFTYLFEPLDPTIAGIDPNHGDTDGGTLVTIYGSNFYCGEGILVYFNNVSAPVVSCSPDKLVVQAPPAHDVGIINCTEPAGIRVLNVCGGLSYNLADSFTYGPEIIISAWGPTRGDANGGTPVTIYGQGFDSPMAVTLAGVGAQVVSVSNNELHVLSGAYDPQGRCGNQSGSIMVTDIECATSFETESSAWTYVSPELFINSVSPSNGMADTLVTITGQGFLPPLEVFFGNTNAAASVSADFTTITVMAPLFPGPYDTQVCTTVPDGCPGTQALTTPVDIKVRSLYTGCTYTFKSFFYNPANPMPAACLPEPPVCAIDVVDGVCSATFTAEPQCGAAYAWSGTWGTCPASATNVYTCNAGTNGVASASVVITNAGGAASCSGSVEVAGCP